MNPTQKSSLFKRLALPILAGLAFITSVSPASALTDSDPPAAGSSVDALSSTIGPKAARAITEQVGTVDPATARMNYLVSCVDGHGYVSVWIPGTSTSGYATFECVGTYIKKGVL